MSQAETFQDIYAKIADIYDKFCDFGDDETFLQTNLTLSDTSFLATSIAFSNPNNKQSISDAQNRINALIESTLLIAKDERLSNDQVFAASNGDLVPIPKGSPMELLPKLLAALLLYSAPLKFLVSIIVDVIEAVLKEYLKRKLGEKTASRGDSISFDTSKIFPIPYGASHLIVQLSSFPSYVSQRFDQDINKSAIKTDAQPNPNLSKYTRDGLATVSFGIGLSGEIITKNIFWREDKKIEYVNQILEIPEFIYTNIDKYAYIYLNESMQATISFLK